MLALAAVAALAEAAPLAFECTAPFREPSELLQNHVGSTHRVNGRIHFDEFYDILPQPPDAEWRYVGPVPDTRGVTVELLDMEESVYVTLAIGPHQRSTDVLEVVLGWQIGEAAQSRLLTTLLRQDLGFDVRFSIVSDGRRVSVEAAGARTDLDLTLGPRAHVSVGCHGGKFYFRDLEWGD